MRRIPGLVEAHARREPAMNRRLSFPIAAVLDLAAAPLPAADAPREVTPKPPVAAKKPHPVVSPNGTRDDPYYWLRDDSRSKPEVLNYLKDENAYYAAETASYKDLTEKLSKEILDRLKQDDSSVPFKDKDYVYYQRYEPGKEYAVQARRSKDSTKELILLDGNKQAAGKSFYSLAGRSVSPKQDLYAYLEDTTGRRQYTLKIREIATGKDRPESIAGLSGQVAWAADNKTLFYIENDPVTLLSTRVRRHVLGTDPKTDPVVYEEKDHSFYISVDESGDERFVVIRLRSTTEAEMLVIDAADPAAAPKVFAKRTKDHLYGADHIAGRWIIRTNLNAPNYRMMAVADAEAFGGPDAWKDLLPYDKDVFIEDFALFKDYLAINERSEGLLRLRVRPWTDLNASKIIQSHEPAYPEELAINPEQDTDMLRYTHDSLITPTRTYDVNMKTGERKLLKEQPVLGGFDAKNYVTERVWAMARDGVKVPASLAYRKGFKKDGTPPMYQTGYGAYGAS